MTLYIQKYVGGGAVDFVPSGTKGKPRFFFLVGQALQPLLYIIYPKGAYASKNHDHTFTVYRHPSDHKFVY